MSFIARVSKPATAAARVTSQTQLRAFSLSSASMLKESNKDTPDQAEKYEAHKHDQLEKQKSGKGHWKPELASNSEEAVRADKNGKTVEQLQKETKERSESDRKSGNGTSQSDPNL